MHLEHSYCFLLLMLCHYCSEVDVDVDVNVDVVVSASASVCAIV